MLYDLIQTRKGKETVMMTDELSKVNKRMAALRKSQRTGIKNQKVEYRVQSSEQEAKFKKKPSKSWRGYN